MPLLSHWDLGSNKGVDTKGMMQSTPKKCPLPLSHPTPNLQCGWVTTTHCGFQATSWQRQQALEGLGGRGGRQLWACTQRVPGRRTRRTRAGCRDTDLCMCVYVGVFCSAHTQGSVGEEEGLG